MDDLIELLHFSGENLQKGYEALRLEKLDKEDIINMYIELKYDCINRISKLKEEVIELNKIINRLRNEIIELEKEIR